MAKVTNQDKLILLQDIKERIVFVLNHCSDEAEKTYARSLIKEHLAPLLTLCEESMKQVNAAC